MPLKSFSPPLTEQSPALCPSNEDLSNEEIEPLESSVLGHSNQSNRSKKKKKTCIRSKCTQKRLIFDKSYAFKSHVISNDRLFVPFICPKINDLGKYKDRNSLIHFHIVNVQHCQRNNLDQKGNTNRKKDEIFKSNFNPG